MWKDPHLKSVYLPQMLCVLRGEVAVDVWHTAPSPQSQGARWQAWAESCCLSPVLQWNVLYRVLLGSPEPAERCVKSRTLAGSFAITQHVCWVNKVTSFSLWISAQGCKRRDLHHGGLFITLCLSTWKRWNPAYKPRVQSHITEHTASF